MKKYMQEKLQKNGIIFVIFFVAMEGDAVMADSITNIVDSFPNDSSNKFVIFDDFEGNDFGAWKVEGIAFGNRPAKGTLTKQMNVSGFQGKGLVNSYHEGDSSTGMMTSRPFTIKHNWMTFLIGGGGWAGETCINLIIDGKVVRTATGINVSSSGTEELKPRAWDLAEFRGKAATLQIVDSCKGGWGHINVDYIAFADDKGDIPEPDLVPTPLELTRELTIDADYLQLPLLDRKSRNVPGASKLTVEVNGEVVRFLHPLFPEPGQKPDFWYSVDLSEFRGKKVTLRYVSTNPDILSSLKLGNEQIIDPDAYTGPHRPRFHFSPRHGWMNDVNGTYFYDGLYHLFYQYNPTMTGSSAGFDMHWGHSVSKDLIHWEEWPIALFPDDSGNCYSGTALMLQEHISGVNDGAPLPTPTLFFTATAPFSQHFATTCDGGKTWQRFDGNPVLNSFGGQDRDPKVIWHEASKHYVMVLFVDRPNNYYFLRSKDLKTWEVTQKIPGWFECPEFLSFKSPTTGEDLWLLYGCYTSPKDVDKKFSGTSVYQLGKFDGKTFTPLSEHRHAHLGGNFYGALTFVNEPKERNVMMGWTRGTKSPGEPFNQAATVPLHMQLKAIQGQDILCFEPTVEVEKLRGKAVLTLKNTTGAKVREQLSKLEKDASLDVVVRFKKDQTRPVTVTMRSLTFTFDSASGKLNNKYLLHPDGELDTRFLIDRTVVESFWNGGEAAFCNGSLHTDGGSAFAINDEAQIAEITVYPMKSIW